MKPRYLAITVIILALSPSRTVPLNAADTWPLVKFADGTVRGQAIAIEDSGEDRYILVAIAGGGSNPVSRGNGTILLRERAGRHPDGTSLAPGSSGLFLWTWPTSPTAGHDATLIAGGFMPDVQPTDAARVDQLIAAVLANDDVPISTAFDLLDSPSEPARLFAARCLQEQLVELTTDRAARLRAAIESEVAPRVLVTLLDLLLVRQWRLDGVRFAAVVLTRESSELRHLALEYRTRHPDPEDTAQLLTAYPGADNEARMRLLTAYAHLGLRESEPWWHDALLSDDPKLVQHALEELAVSSIDSADAILIALVKSESARIRELAVRGLGSRGTPAAVRALRAFVADVEPDEPLGRLAHRMLRYPYRYGRVKPAGRRGS